MEEIKPLTLVKWDYDGLPKEWKQKNPNRFKGMTFMYFGGVNGMKSYLT
jgi:hypothetical protein